MWLSDTYPRIKYRNVEEKERLSRLKRDLAELKREILKESPSDFTTKNLDAIEYRIFRFPRDEIAGELYIAKGRKTYVCIDARIAKRSYYGALQFALHGTAHAFSHFRDSIADEAFCEYSSYKILSQHLAKKGENYRRKVIKSVMKLSSSEYNTYLRAARRLEEIAPGTLRKLNNKAKHRNIVKAKERQIFRKYVRHAQLVEGEPLNSEYELEKGFKTVR